MGKHENNVLHSETGCRRCSLGSDRCWRLIRSAPRCTILPQTQRKRCRLASWQRKRPGTNRFLQTDVLRRVAKSRLLLRRLCSPESGSDTCQPGRKKQNGGNLAPSNTVVHSTGRTCRGIVGDRRTGNHRKRRRRAADFSDPSRFHSEIGFSDGCEAPQRITSTSADRDAEKIENVVKRFVGLLAFALFLQ